MSRRDAPALRIEVLGLGVLGPGMNDAAGALAAMRDPSARTDAATVVPAPTRLPPAERRRAGAIVKLGLSVADQAVVQSGLDASTLATVFTAASGDGANLHAMCETLATPERLVSPTRFTNSVHNAAAGYWHIAVASRAPSTSLAAHDAGFSAGLLEAASQCASTGRPVLLVAGDTPYPEPLATVRRLVDAIGMAFVLAPHGTTGSLATLSIAMQGPGATPDAFDDAGLESLRLGAPAGRGLPLVRALAGDGPARCVLEFVDDLSLVVHVEPHPAKVPHGVPGDVAAA